MGDSEDSLEVVAVGLDASVIWGDGEDVLARLVDELGSPEHRRLIFLPPLVANIMAYDQESRGRGLERAARLSAAGRKGRRFAVRFAYPEAPAQRRPHLVNHDRVHRALRGPLASLARRAEATLVAGTAVLDHPRPHWEDWPDTGHLFHTAWTFGDDTEPRDTLRDSTPCWEALEAMKVDPSRPRDEPALRTGLGPVDVLWTDDPLARPWSGPVVWAPRAWSGQAHSPESSLASTPAGLLGADAKLAVRTCLSGELGAGLHGETFIASRRSDDLVVSQMAGAPIEGLAWCRTVIPWPWSGQG